MINIGRAERKRWAANVKAMEIVAKPREEVTAEEIEFLKESYTSMGGLLPKGFNGGAFFTPTHVARFMWDVLKPKLPPNPRVLEPSCGAGVFLEHAPPDAEITALELDETSAKVTSLIYPHANVIQGNAILHDRYDYYDIVIGNPPYGETIEIPVDEYPQFSDWQTLRRHKPKNKPAVWRGKSEAVFIEHALRCVKPGGYIAFIMPIGFSYNTQVQKARELLYCNCWHVATIMLPGETFQHVGTTVETQILIVRKVTPNARMIDAVTKRWGSNFRRSDWTDITGFKARFFEGQTPAYFAKVMDIGWDAKGNSTDKWGDGLTQLDELVDDFTDRLVRENLYPHIPSWYGLERDITQFMFSHGNDTCDGYRDAKLTYPDGPYRWQELTLGAGEEVEWRRMDGTVVERSTWDFGWQDEIVHEWYEKGGGDN